MHTRRPGPPIRLNTTEFRRLARHAGLLTDEAIADRIGVHRITVWRILGGQQAVGTAFIAAVLAGFPGTTFEDVFEVPAAARKRVKVSRGTQRCVA